MTSPDNAQYFIKCLAEAQKRKLRGVQGNDRKSREYPISPYKCVESLQNKILLPQMTHDRLYFQCLSSATSLLEICSLISALERVGYQAMR
jgi:hypothetical protein